MSIDSPTSVPTLTAGPAGWGRAVWSAAEPWTIGAYFTPEAAGIAQAVGLPPETAFIPLRSAPLGDAHPAVVAAALRGFPLEMVAAVLADSRLVLTPETALRALHDAVVAAGHRQLPAFVEDRRVDALAGDLEAVVRELDASGRPLAAGGQAVAAAGSATAATHPWSRLWRASNTLREYRGDAHVAALTAADLPRTHADVLAVAWAGEQFDVGALRVSRGLDAATWDTAVEALRGRGLLHADGTITVQGCVFRDDLERATDRAAADPFRRLGGHRSREAWEFFAEVSGALIDSGQMLGTTPVGAPWPPVPFPA